MRLQAEQGRSLAALLHRWRVRPAIVLLLHLASSSGIRAEVLVRIVVVARQGAHDGVELAAMTKTMLGDAEVMHGLGPVPLLQRQSAVESRWTRTVPTSRESARQIFRSGTSVFAPHQNGSRPACCDMCHVCGTGGAGARRDYRFRFELCIAVFVTNCERKM